jgi:asparagine synthase (glutamine-hydrolysing)
MNLLFGWHDPERGAADSESLARQLGDRFGKGARPNILQQGSYLLAGTGPQPASSASSRQVGAPTGQLPGYREADNGQALGCAGGQFAWAASDGVGLLVAVDRFASIPVFYHRTATALIFSSDLHLLLAHPNAAGLGISHQALFDYLFFSVVPGHQCAYEGIEKLGPGCWLQQTAERVSTRRYWLPDFSRTGRRPKAELQTGLIQSLGAAVASAASLDQPGCFLSGGLDSSSVCGLAARHLGPGVPAITIGFDEADFDETEYAAIAARQYGLDWHNESITADDIQTRIDEVVAGYAEPFGNASAVSALICAQIAKQQGISNLLAGDGGDELFGGNYRYQKQMLFGYYEQLPSLLRKTLLDPFAAAAGKPGWGPIAKLGSYVRQARVPLPDRLFAYNLLARNAPDKVLTPEFLAQVDVASPYQYARSVYNTPQDADTLDRMLFLDWTLTLADNDLPKVRGTCNIAGVEVHFPMLDAAVVDLSVAVPSRDKIGLRSLRRFYKQAFREILPAEILTKPKHGFGVPVGLWFEKSPALGDRLHKALNSLRSRGIVQAQFIDEMLRLQRTEHAVYYGSLNWTLFMLEEWLAHYRLSL